jgi:hypothetical protein
MSEMYRAEYPPIGNRLLISLGPLHYNKARWLQGGQDGAWPPWPPSSPFGGEGAGEGGAFVAIRCGEDRHAKSKS